MYFLYILFSEKLNKYYVGSTGNLAERLRKHNANHKGFTGTAKDWVIKYTEKFELKLYAMHREKEIKNWKSRVRIEKLLDSTSGSQHPDL